MQAVLLGLFLSLTVRHELDDNNARSVQRLESQTQLLAHLTQRSLEAGDAGQTQDLVNAVMASPVINQARITDLDGNTMALSPVESDGMNASELAQIKPPFVYHSFRGAEWRVRRRSAGSLGRRPIALAWIEPDPATLRRVPHSLVQNALEYAVLALLVNVLLAVILARTISRPLSILVAGTKALASDPEHSLNFPLPITTFNEAGELTESFNATVLELRRQRAGLRETLAMLDSMLATAPIGFAFYDRDLHYVRVNQYLAGIHDIPIDSHIGRHLRDMVTSGLESQIEAGIQQVFATGKPLYEMELEGATGDRPGESRSWIMSFYPVHTEDQEVRWVGKVAIETTQRRKSEDALRKTEKLAAAGRLAASIAHEINNPLEAVTNLLYLLHNHPSLDTEARQYSQMAQSELSRVSQITQQTLRFYRQSTQPTPGNLAEIVDSVLLLHNARIHGASVEVLREYTPSADLRCLRRRAAAGARQPHRQRRGRHAARRRPSARSRPPGAGLVWRESRGRRPRHHRRHRLRHARGGAPPHLRAVLHHQGGHRHRPRPLGQRRDRRIKHAALCMCAAARKHLPAPSLPSSFPMTGSLSWAISWVPHSSRTGVPGERFCSLGW